MSRRSPRAMSPRSPDVQPAITMRGWTGRYSSINGTYEPTGMHNNYPCWSHRANTNVIFHTAKTRWVVSKELGDGSSCFAYMADDGSGTPAQRNGVWTRCNESGQWVEDLGLKCTETASNANDPFVRIRFAAEEELRKARIADEADRQKMWNKIDKNGDGAADLAEVETLVDELCKTGVWPRWINNEASLQRAYKQTLDDSITGDDQVDQEDFHSLLLNIFWFGRVHEVFAEIDTGDDENVDINEFTAGLDKLGVRYTPAQAQAEFRTLDKSGDGLADLGEFCLWVRNKIQPDSSEGPYSADHKKVQCHEQIRLSCGNGATTGCVVKKKAWNDFDALEKKIQKLVHDPSKKGLKKLWSELDYNGNNRVSLAETDKWVVEQFPILNHKPALMRAQQATLKAGGNRDYVEKKDFKALLVNLFYYNKLFWVFDHADEGRDRRMDFKEFQFCLNMCGEKLSPAKAKSEFEKVDVNHGGQILFDEFCEYFVNKKCPEGLTSFVSDE